MRKSSLNSDQAERHTLALPALLYRDLDSKGKPWVAVSLMTCTTAVNRNRSTAIKTLIRLVGVEAEAVASECFDTDEVLETFLARGLPENYLKVWHLSESVGVANNTAYRNVKGDAEHYLEGAPSYISLHFRDAETAWLLLDIHDE